jgi:hypothetical protein
MKIAQGPPALLFPAASAKIAAHHLSPGMPMSQAAAFRLFPLLPVMLLAGCASAPPAVTLMEHIPTPPANAAAAVARCGERQDKGLDSAAAELAALQKQEESQLRQVTEAVKAQPGGATAYSKQYPQAAEALVKRQDGINGEYQELNLRMDVRAQDPIRALAAALDRIDGVERSQLNLCQLVLVDNHWIQKAECTDPVRAQAKAQRAQAADKYLADAQAVWRDWRQDAEQTLAGWDKIPEGTPDAGNVYVQLAELGYRHTQTQLAQQFMGASTNLCGLAVQAVNRPDIKP